MTSSQIARGCINEAIAKLDGAQLETLLRQIDISSDDERLLRATEYVYQRLVDLVLDAAAGTDSYPDGRPEVARQRARGAVLMRAGLAHLRDAVAQPECDAT